MLGKIVHCKLPEWRLEIDLSGGPKVFEFHDHRAVLPDDVALAITRISDFYRVVRDVWREPIQSVLLMRDGGAGDIMLTTPLIRHLVKQGIQVHYVTREAHAPLLYNNPYLSSVQVAELIPEPWNRVQAEDFDVEGAREEFDAVIDLRWHAERAESEGFKGHRAASFFSAIEQPASDDLSLDLILTPEERSWADSLILPKHPSCAYVWSSTTKNRNWSDQQHERVIKALTKRGITVFLLAGEPIGADDNLVVDLGGKLTIRQACAIVGACDVTITPDTGLFHVAQALGRPTLASFGPFPMSSRATAPAVATIINGAAGCEIWPCRAYSCIHAGTGRENVCLRADPEIMAEEALEICNRTSHGDCSTRPSRGAGQSLRQAPAARR